MTTSRVLQLSQPIDILRAIPHVLGFHPTNSLVVLWMAGTQIILGQRVDLPARQDSDVQTWVSAVWSPVHSVSADAVVLAVYVDQLGTIEGYRALMTALIASAPVRVRDFLAAGSDGWCDASGRRREWQHHASAPRDTSHDALSDFFGSEPLVSREALSLAPVAPIKPPSSRPPGREVCRQAIHLVKACVSSPLSNAEIAIVTRGLRSIPCRDTVLTSILDNNARSLAHAWDPIVIRMPSLWGAPLASLSALAHWLSGDGARANVALERALADDPSYALAMLVDAVVARATPPDQVREWLEELRPKDAVA